MRRHILPGLVCFALVCGLAAPRASDVLLADFEDARASERWTFSKGGEFPGAEGGFDRTPEGAANSRHAGRLTFDFKKGGRYVSAILRVPDEAAATPEWNALKVWLKRPDGNEVQLRYTDSAGQTFQKPVECVADRWVEVTVPFSNWVNSWGGPNDGKPRGRLKQLALLIDHGQQQTGALLLDQLRLTQHEVTVARVAYPAYQFKPEEGWRMRSEGNGGASKLEGKLWTLDFRQGAKSMALTVPDHVLLGDVEQLRIKVRGGARGLPVRVVMRTHFMTFHKLIGELAGEGEQELVTEGPPGPGWQWYGGENDGRIHGPLRLAEIQIEGDGKTERCTIEMGEVVVDASCPAEKRCVLVAGSKGESGAVQFNARMRALTDKPLNGELNWVLRDWDGREMKTGKQRVTLGAKAAEMEVKLSSPAPLMAEKKYVEAEFFLDLPGQNIPPVLTAWVAPLTQPGDAAMMPESPFGMGVYLNRYSGDAKGLAMMERAAQMARDAGVKWSREDFSWSRIERRKGEFDWAYYDNLVACAKRNGITVYGIICYWSSWTKPYTSEGIADYVQFVKALVQRYRTDIRKWEIWNEPNIFFWQGPKDMYAELLAKSYAAIKQIDPEIQVLGLSTAGIDTEYIRRMLELKAPFDILTIHPYRKQLNDRAFIDDLKNVSDQVKLPDGQRRPVWLTEMGWATHTPHNTVRQDFASNSLRVQAELIVRSYLCAIVSGVEPRTFWYNFRNDGDDPIYFEHQMGILYNDFQPKPAYRAYATLTKTLRGKVLDCQLPTSKEAFAFCFKAASGSGGEVIAAWNPLGDSKVELPVSGHRVTRINAVGEEQPVSAERGKITVHLRKGAVEYFLSQ